MASDNLTVVLHKPMDLRLEQRPIPNVKDDEVLLRIDCVGICGSDIHYWSSGGSAGITINEPMVMGHEASGIVAKVGANVTHLKEGDRVTVEPHVPCKVCEFCKIGRYNLCSKVLILPNRPLRGSLTRYYVHAADYCYKLPDHVSMEEGAMIEPLAVGVHACRRGNISIGSVVLILGAGPIGIVTLLCAKAMGASKVLITDILQSRLDFAKTLGADHTILVSKDYTESDLVQKIHQTLDCHPDISLDCSGIESTIRMAILATKSGGVAVLVGMGKAEANIPLAKALTREVDIRGVFRYCNDYPFALAMVASGAIDVKPLVTHHFTMEDTLEAFETFKAGHGVKVMIHVQPRDTNNKKG